MRVLSVMIVLILAVGGQAAAADIPAASRIEAVTVFPSGAEITRTLKAKLVAGEQTVLVNDATGQAVPGSIRVEAEAGGPLKIMSVDAHRVELPSTDPAVTQSARKKLEDQIQALRDRYSELGDVVKVAREQKRYLRNLERLPRTQGTGSSSGPREDWIAIYDLIGTRMTELGKTAREARLKRRELDRQIKDLKKELAAAGGKSQDRMEMRIHIKATEPLEATLTIRYQVTVASWTAFYDARLTTGDEQGAKRKLSIARYASIAQTSGEDWENVTLALSTTRPDTATAAPDLNMLSVDFGAAQLKVGGRGGDSWPSPPTVSKEIVTKQSGDFFANKEKIIKIKKVLVAKEGAPQTVASSFQAVYDIPGRATIKANGEAKRLQIMAEEVEPALLVRTVPRLDHAAYLYASLTLPKSSSPVLPGQVSLLRDGVYVGTGQFPQLSPGEEFELGFGADERVKVRRVVREDKKGSVGTFTTSRVEERSFSITVKNLHARAVKMQILDRMPVPMHEDIKVEVTMTSVPQPTKNDVNDRRGTMLWQMQAEPDEEKQIAFGYRITAPGDKPIHYREMTDEEIQSNQINRAARPAPR